jgi:hypothetical protein
VVQEQRRCLCGCAGKNAARRQLVSRVSYGFDRGITIHDPIRISAIIVALALLVLSARLQRERLGVDRGAAAQIAKKGSALC